MLKHTFCTALALKYEHSNFLFYLVRRGKLKQDSELLIHDSFVDKEDRLLFLCDYDGKGEWFWLTSSQIKVL